MKDFCGKSIKPGDTVVALVELYRPYKSFLKQNVVHHIKEYDGQQYAYFSESDCVGYPSEHIVKVKAKSNK